MRAISVFSIGRFFFLILTLIMFAGCGGGGGTAAVVSGGGGAGGSVVTSVTLSWDNPQTNTDGTTITDLGGYRVYYGLSSDSLSSSVDVGNSVSCVINDLAPGSTYYFAVTTYDTAGNESDFSPAVSILI